jgi:hypothetical protein
VAQHTQSLKNTMVKGPDFKRNHWVARSKFHIDHFVMTSAYYLHRSMERMMSINERGEGRGGEGKIKIKERRARE